MSAVRQESSTGNGGHDGGRSDPPAQVPSSLYYTEQTTNTSDPAMTIHSFAGQYEATCLST